ncbi:MAG TPA: hypothetical protein VGE07_24215, partial [Herpetosiphonaceae bacterium]
MKRLVRLVSLWVLAGILASMLPPAPARSATPATPASGFPSPPVFHQPSPPPRPAEAKPGGYTAEEAERLIA